MLAENERQFKRSRQRHYIRDACTEWRAGGRAAFGYTKAVLAKTAGHRGKTFLDVQILCLLRVADTSKLIKDGRPKAVLAESNGHSCKRVCHYKTYAC